MDALQTTVLVIATLVAGAGGAFIANRELTAPERRRVSVARDVIEVIAPLVALVVLIVGVWVAV